MKRTEEMRRIEKTWESMRRVNGPVGKSGELKTSSSEQSCKPRLRQEVVPVLSTIPMAYSMVGKVLSLCSMKEACDITFWICVHFARKTTPTEPNRLCRCLALHEPELILEQVTQYGIQHERWRSCFKQHTCHLVSLDFIPEWLTLKNAFWMSARSTKWKVAILHPLTSTSWTAAKCL